MEAAPFEFLKRLIETPSPSGYERPVQEVVRAYVADFAERVETDVHGNVIAVRNPEGRLRVMLAGHCDQIGMLISHIDDDGFLYAQTIGGWDPQQLVGQRMTIWAKHGPVPAVISRKPIHLLEEEERKQVVKIKELWLDIGTRSKKEADELVRIGDPVTLQLGYQALQNNLANAPGMDDRAGLWVVLEALRRCGPRLQGAIYSVSTVAEEVGLRGARTSAFRVDPHVAVAVDVTHATDSPSIDQRQHGRINLGGGPVIFRGPNINPHVAERLIESADTINAPYQLAALGRAASNDSNSLQINRQGVATGLVAIPNRYMHSAVETISLDDLDHAANLLASFVTNLATDDDFTP